MSAESRMHISKAIRMALLVAGIVGLATGLMAWQQLLRERRSDLEDEDRRAHVLAYQMKESVQDALRHSDDKEVVKELGTQIEGHRRLIGFAVIAPTGDELSAAKACASLPNQFSPR